MRSGSRRHEGGVGRLNAGKVELARGERRQLRGGLVHDDDDEPLKPGRAAERRRKIAVGGKDPAAVGLVRDEAERPVPDRRLVPRRLPQPVARHGVEQVRGEDREVGEHVGKAGERRGEAKDDGRVVGRFDPLQSSELGGSRIPHGRIARGVQGPADVARRGRDPVVPGDARGQPERERAPIGRPGPAACEIRPRHERRVVAREGGEQDVALDLAGERMERDERVHALQVGARRKQHGRPAPRRGRLAREQAGEENGRRQAGNRQHGGER